MNWIGLGEVVVDCLFEIRKIAVFPLAFIAG